MPAGQWLGISPCGWTTGWSRSCCSAERRVRCCDCCRTTTALGYSPPARRPSIRYSREQLFSGEESALLRLLQNYHSIGIQSSCKAAIYQVQYRESCCLAKRRVPCCDSCAVDSASVFSFLMCCWCFACDKATEVLQHHCLY